MLDPANWKVLPMNYWTIRCGAYSEVLQGDVPALVARLRVLTRYFDREVWGANGRDVYLCLLNLDIVRE